MNLGRAAFKPAHDVHILEIPRKDHNRERAGHLVFTEVDEMNRSARNPDPQDSSGDALHFADMPLGFMYSNTVGRE